MFKNAKNGSRITMNKYVHFLLNAKESPSSTFIGYNMH